MTVIDIGGINLWLVQTDVSEVEGIKVPVLADRNDAVGDRDEMIIEGTGQIVYETASGAIDDCTGLLKPLTQYESQTLGGPRMSWRFILEDQHTVKCKGRGGEYVDPASGSTRNGFVALPSSRVRSPNVGAGPQRIPGNLQGD